MVNLCAKIADEMKAEDIEILKIGPLSTIADYFIICAGNSTPHLNAISDKVVENIRKNLGKKPRLSGDPQSGWIALDYGSVIMHIFSKPMREKYNLEGLWNDAPKVEKKVKSKKTR